MEVGLQGGEEERVESKEREGEKMKKEKERQEERQSHWLKQRSDLPPV